MNPQQGHDLRGRFEKVMKSPAGVQLEREHPDWRSLMFAPGQRVIFRESGDGPAHFGHVAEVCEPTPEHPGGGEYDIDLEAGGSVIAWWEELQAAGDPT